MALIISDTHGNIPKIKMFLKYKPEEEKIFCGDMTDSYHASDNDIIESINLLLNSNIYIIAGNHDTQYFNNSDKRLKCTGYRDSCSLKIVNLFEKNKDIFKASTIADGYIITHGGITKSLQKYTDLNMEEMNDWLNSEFDDWKNSPVIKETLSPIFNIGTARGGWDKFSGIFWADYRYDKYANWNQVFGHSHTSSPKYIKIGKFPHNIHICIDSPQFICFNTKTGEFEDFMFEEFKSTRNMLERLY